MFDNLKQRCLIYTIISTSHGWLARNTNSRCPRIILVVLLIMIEFVFIPVFVLPFPRLNNGEYLHQTLVLRISNKPDQIHNYFLLFTPSWLSCVRPGKGLQDANSHHFMSLYDYIRCFHTKKQNLGILLEVSD